MTNIIYKRFFIDFYELGKELATLRKSKNISQQTISKDLNISRATISNFETGKSYDIGLKKVLQKLIEVINK